MSSQCKSLGLIPRHFWAWLCQPILFNCFFGWYLWPESSNCHYIYISTSYCTPWYLWSYAYIYGILSCICFTISLTLPYAPFYINHRLWITASVETYNTIPSFIKFYCSLYTAPEKLYRQKKLNKLKLYTIKLYI